MQQLISIVGLLRLGWISAFFDLSSIIQPSMTSRRHGRMRSPILRHFWRSSLLRRILRPFIRRSIFSGAVSHDLWLWDSSHFQIFITSHYHRCENSSLNFVSKPSYFFYLVDFTRWNQYRLLLIKWFPSIVRGPILILFGDVNFLTEKRCWDEISSTTRFKSHGSWLRVYTWLSIRTLINSIIDRVVG